MCLLAIPAQCEGDGGDVIMNMKTRPAVNPEDGIFINQRARRRIKRAIARGDWLNVKYVAPKKVTHLAEASTTLTIPAHSLREEDGIVLRRNSPGKLRSA